MKRILILLLVAVMLIASLVSCSTVAGDKDLNKVETAGTIVVGMECAYAPYNWATSTSSATTVPISNSPGSYADGYDVQIAKLIAEKLGVELEIKAIEWDGLIPALESGQIDMIIAGMSPTDERKLSIDFSNTYFDSNLVMVVKKDGAYADADDIQDFSNAKVTAQLNTFHYTVIDQIAGVNKQTALADFAALMQSLSSGAIDGYVCEKPGAISAVAANEEFTYIEFSNNNGFTCDPAESSISVGLRLGSTLLDPINAAINELTTEDKEALMDAAITRQPAVEYLAEVVELTTNDVFKKLITEYWPQFLNGTKNTLIMALTGTILGFAIGLLIAVIRTIPVETNDNIIKKIILKVVGFLLTAYVEIVRGTPMLVQALIVHYSLFVKLGMSSMTSAIIIISFNTAAYMAEIARGGIMSIDKGQFEGAHAIGMSHFQTMFNVVLPQAIKNIMPSIGNEFVVNIKDSSVLSVISITELMFIAKQAGGTYAKFVPAYIICAVIYFVLTFTVTRLLRLAEKKMAGPNSYTICGSQSDSSAEIHVKEEKKEWR